MKPGTLLLPNSYLIANNRAFSGIILEVLDDLWGKNYRIFLSNGNIVWKDEKSIRDLWDVVEQ